MHSVRQIIIGLLHFRLKNVYMYVERAEADHEKELQGFIFGHAL